MSNEAARLCNEGLELMSQHRWVEAEEKMIQAAAEDPDSPELHYNVGKCFFHQDNYSLAIHALGKAVNLKDSYAEAHALLGNCYYAIHDLYAARICFGRAAHRFKQAGNEEAHLECLTANAHSILAAGNYNDWGWTSYQARLKEPDTWTGTQSLVGKTLLIKAEGGLGDQIFFARYARMLEGLGVGYALWEVNEPLVSYFRCSLDVHPVERGKIVAHDYMVHAGSLPYIFGTKAGTIPVFSERASHVENPTHIGIACSGNPLHPDDHHRSIPLAEFAPILELDKNFFLAQQAVRASDLPNPKITAPEDIEDVNELGDVLNSLDLVITVDTMTAHLAGAEGIPTWLLLPHACDWRWGLEGERTPWYPCMRIFRQGEDREWGPVIQRVVEELKNGC